MEQMSNKIHTMNEEIKTLQKIESSLREENLNLKNSKRKITELYQKSVQIDNEENRNKNTNYFQRQGLFFKNFFFFINFIF